VLIRDEEPSDVDAVAQVHREAFVGNHGEVVAALVDDLRALLDHERGLSLVAERRGQVVGHVMFSRGLLDAPARLVAVEILSPVGVRPQAQGIGVASALIRRGLEILSAREVPAVFLEGDPRFYSRFGFIPAGSHGFRKPSLRIPDAGFQVITLPSHEPWMTGTLVYPEAFWRHDLVGLRDINPDRDDDGLSLSPGSITAILAELVPAALRRRDAAPVANRSERHSEESELGP
jgi:putative acetyltransferase